MQKYFVKENKSLENRSTNYEKISNTTSPKGQNIYRLHH